MELRSLAYRTDLDLLAATGSRVSDRGDRLDIVTPHNPGFFWGNWLLFQAPPGPGDAPRWLAAFETTFAGVPGVRHMAFGWDSPEGETGDVAPFESMGFEVEVSSVLTARTVRRPHKHHDGLTVRPLSSEADWEAAIENQVITRDESFEEAAYRRFKRSQMASARQLSERGVGARFGAFDRAGTLLGDGGVFVFNGLGRFQSIATHPAHRRQGVCGALVYAMAREALTALGARELVIVAEPDAPAEGIYRSVGFEPTERQVGMCRPDPVAKPGG